MENFVPLKINKKNIPRTDQKMENLEANNWRNLIQDGEKIMMTVNTMWLSIRSPGSCTTRIRIFY